MNKIRLRTLKDKLHKHNTPNKTAENIESKPVPTNPPVARGEYGITSYSQEGEDVVLRRFVGEKPGFYVDIGAHHPQRFSNTYFYSKLGWKGINVDADPDLIDEFEHDRPNDINVACAVGSESKALIFYVFNERAISTFDESLAKERATVKGWKILEKRKIPVKTLTQLLDEHLPAKTLIDFMTIDVEGKDLEVLKTNDWDKYRPRFLLAECYGDSKKGNSHKEIVSFITKHRYKQVAKTLYTAIFADMDVYEGP